MIKNRRGLLKNLTPDAKKCRRVLLDIADYVIQNLAPEKLLQKTLVVRDLKKFRRIVIISIGKAAKPMTKAILPFIKRKPDFVLIANQGHPLPTKQGMNNTKRILKVAKSLDEHDLAIVLISGGGSAMLTMPVDKITLEDKIKTTKDLLRSGATINELNVVRKHLSQVKGGKLAELLYPATVWGFVISDVVGNDLSTIASGPLSPDKSTFKDALRILKKYKIKTPKRIETYLQKRLRNQKIDPRWSLSSRSGGEDDKRETPKNSAKCFDKVKIKILADHSTVIKKAEEKAKKLGLKVDFIKKPLTGECRDVAIKFMRYAKNLPKNTLLIAGGETTVTCRGNGCGGRNQEFVLAGLPYLTPSQTLISIGTDGVDGICPEPIAGAIGDAATLKSAQKQKLKINDFLKRNDSYTFFKKTSDLIKTGPTGTNVGDLVMVMG